jgi:hypothetical protein
MIKPPTNRDSFSACTRNGYLGAEDVAEGRTLPHSEAGTQFDAEHMQRQIYAVLRAKKNVDRIVSRCRCNHFCNRIRKDIPSIISFLFVQLPDDRAIILAMAIHMGIMCDACGTVHFIATSPGIGLSDTGGRMYKLTCKPECSSVRHFRKEEMRSYRVADDIFNTGFAEVGKYELVEGRITGRAS